MKYQKAKQIFFLICIFITQVGLSQQIEFGPNIGYGFTSIANSRITEGRAVIGRDLRDINQGFSVVFYFNNPRETTTNGIHFEYLTSQRGARSEKYSGNEYNFNSKSFNLNYRPAGSLGNNFGIYADLGLGYNMLDNVNIYKGNINEFIAFEKIEAPFLIKDNEITFLYGFGVDKLILKNKFIVFLEFNGDAGISKINRNSGAFRTQSLGFAAGLRYLINLKKK